MSDFDSFKKSLLDGNLDGVRNYMTNEFVEKIIDFSSQKRPIHFASSSGHTDIVKVLIEERCNFESETKTKMRPLHFASKEGHIDIVQLLIDLNCNIESETQYKRRSIHLACTSGHIDIVNLLIQNKCDLECETQNKRKPIHCACMEGNVGIVKLLIDNKCNLESETQNKWKPIHYACEKGQIDIVKLLIGNKCDSESESGDKWRPIHCACLKGHTEVVRLLVSYDCAIHCKTKDGNTPLNVAEKQGHLECVQYLNEVIIDLKKVFDVVKADNIEAFRELYNYKTLSLLEYPTGLTVIDVALDNKSEKIIHYIKEKPTNRQETDYLFRIRKIGENRIVYHNVIECVLYRSIHYHNSDGYCKNFLAEVINGPCRFINSTFLEVAAQFGSHLSIREILSKTVYNEDEWNRARTVALRYNHSELESVIAERQSLLKRREKAEMSILHTAIYDNDADMVTYIMNHRLVDWNVTHKVFGTGLTLAYSICHGECIDALIKYNINPNIRNQYLQTPLYSAMDASILEHFEYLVDRTDDLNSPGCMGFTILQYGIVRGHPALCELLMRKGADFMQVVEFTKLKPLTGMGIPPIKTNLPLTDKENCLTLCIKIRSLIYPCFLNKLNSTTVDICDSSGDSLLHLAAKVLNPDLCSDLIKHGIPIDKLNVKRHTPLLELLCFVIDRKIDENQDNLLSIMNILVDAGSDITRKTSDGKTILEYASVLNDEKKCIEFFKKLQKIKTIIKTNDVKIALNRNWFDCAEYLISIIPKEVRAIFITTSTFTSQKLGSTLTKTLFVNATEQVKQTVVENLLLQAAFDLNDDLFQFLLESSVVIQPRLMDNGETLLTNLIISCEEKYSLQILQSKFADKYIKLKNMDQKGPIRLSVEKNCLLLLHNLLTKIDSINNEDKDGKPILSLMFQRMADITDETVISEWESMVKKVIDKGGDINQISSHSMKIIDECINLRVRSEIETYVNGSKTNDSAIQATNKINEL